MAELPYFDAGADEVLLVDDELPYELLPLLREPPELPAFADKKSALVSTTAIVTKKIMCLLNMHPS